MVDALSNMINSKEIGIKGVITPKNNQIILSSTILWL
jgi:hypothetical protein